jgi:hypothetical protein
VIGLNANCGKGLESLSTRGNERVLVAAALELECLPSAVMPLSGGAF